MAVEIENRLEKENWLFQPPRYKRLDSDSGYHGDYWKVAAKVASPTWDLAAIYSLMTNAYVIGNRTLLHEVRRQPWMSLDSNGKFTTVPPHGRKWSSAKQIAAGLVERLEDEIEAACAGIEDLWLLLSGGLDSRIVSGVCKRLLVQGRLDVEPKTVTWGIPESRDVHYGKKVAELLGFNWSHAALEQSDLERHINSTSLKIANMASPVHLHRMDWFEQLSSNSLVLGGSYGDSVGRSEFSGRTVLELTPLSPKMLIPFMKEDFQQQSSETFQADLDELYDRLGDRPLYVRNEIDQQAHYMRGHIAQVMSVINSYFRLYQAFTAPDVYQYMWSFHPAARTDEVYTHVLKQLGYELIDVPWARTNVGVTGVKRFAKTELKSSYHNYRAWTRQILTDNETEVENLIVRMAWLDANKTVEHMRQLINGKTFGPEYFEFYAWLMSVDSFCRQLDKTPSMPNWNPRNSLQKNRTTSTLRKWSRKSKFLNSKLKQLRRFTLRRKSIINFPPDYS